ncbi:hypothetical protein J6590_020278 [Homalodisca vitripennis]|nr:hypothetical protein J6590_020278 [Homalodisca vitripennis]
MRFLARDSRGGTKVNYDVSNPEPDQTEEYASCFVTRGDVSHLPQELQDAVRLSSQEPLVLSSPPSFSR